MQAITYKILVMKRIFLIVIAAFGLVFSGCKKDKFLHEEPGDFLTIDNAFLNGAQFKTALNYFYYRLRENYIYDDGDSRTLQFGSCSVIKFSQN